MPFEENFVESSKRGRLGNTAQRLPLLHSLHYGVFYFRKTVNIRKLNFISIACFPVRIFLREEKEASVFIKNVFRDKFRKLGIESFVYILGVIIISVYHVSAVFNFLGGFYEKIFIEKQVSRRVWVRVFLIVGNVIFRPLLYHKSRTLV